MAYASRTLSDVEKRYSQIEREGLAVMFGCLRFEMYVAGREFSVITDHKPLVSLFNNPKKPGPVRVERMRLRLQGFDFTVFYRPGKSNPSDYISRHPVVQVESMSDDLSDSYLNMIVEKELIKSISVEDVRKATAEDLKFQRIMKLLMKGSKVDRREYDLIDFRKVWDTLSINDGLLLKGEKIVVPKSLEEDIIRIGHEGHMGIVKCKQLLRSKVWFPGMDMKVEKEIKGCLACQSVVDRVKCENIEVSLLPSGPWEELSVDLWGPTPEGDYLLVLIDHYSRFPEVDFVRSTSANTVILKLDRMLSSMGVPTKINSDNGSPFNSNRFTLYSKYMGFKHHRITPLWPQANGMVENFMRSINKSVRTSCAENLNWKQQLFKFLRNYRATPHPSTGFSPAYLMFQGRQFRSRLPEMCQSYDDQMIRKKTLNKKSK